MPQEQERGIAAETVPVTLAEGELARLAYLHLLAGLDKSDRFLSDIKRDRQEISEEIKTIQVCRTKLFVSTITAMGGSTIAALVAGFSQDYGYPWVFACTMVALVLLTIGILASIEKARAINSRSAFIALLDDAKQLKLSSYHGWSHYRHSLPGCGARRKLGRCSHEHTCRKKGRKLVAAHKLNKDKAMVPSALDSFTSLSAGIYSCLYFLVCVAVALSLALSIAITWKYPIAAILMALVFGGSMFALGVFLWNQLKALRKGIHSFEAYYYTYSFIVRRCTPLPFPFRANETGQLQTE